MNDNADREPWPEPDMVLEPDTVAEPLGCPRCGELRVDYLVWQGDEESLQCHSCGQVYKP